MRVLESFTVLQIMMVMKTHTGVASLLSKLLLVHLLRLPLLLLATLPNMVATNQNQRNLIILGILKVTCRKAMCQRNGLTTNELRSEQYHPGSMATVMEGGEEIMMIQMRTFLPKLITCKIC
jgi:hypothetical protein